MTGAGAVGGPPHAVRTTAITKHHMRVVIAARLVDRPAEMSCQVIMPRSVQPQWTVIVPTMPG